MKAKEVDSGPRASIPTVGEGKRLQRRCGEGLGLRGKG